MHIQLSLSGISKKTSQNSKAW